MWIVGMVDERIEYKEYIHGVTYRTASNASGAIWARVVCTNITGDSWLSYMQVRRTSKV